MVVADTSNDSRFFGQVDEKTKMATRSIVAVPVRFREQCLGVIELINCIGPEGFSPRDLALATKRLPIMPQLRLKMRVTSSGFTN